MKRPSIKSFQRMVLDWYGLNGRHSLPWRPPTLKLRRDGNCDPYKIMVSEVMLQQTQVDRVIEFYKSFLRAFPTARRLAQASVKDLLGHWKGLGYNRRALNLQRAAQLIVQKYGGVFPKKVEDIEALPGIGPYTARAIATFALNQPHVFIETNIRRIFIHHFFTDKKMISDQELMPLIRKALFKKDPRIWYSALMDYGSYLAKIIKNPNRKSRHYAKQSRFEGSRRQARAAIVRFLLKKKSATEAELRRFFQKTTTLSRFESGLSGLLTALSHEGFIRREKAKWMLK